MHEVREPRARYAVKKRSAQPGEDPAANARQVRLFRNGANQAVRIPKEFELPGNDAVIYRDGDRLIIEALPQPPAKGTAAALLLALDEMAKLGPIDEEFPDVDAGLLPLDDINFDDEPA